MNLEALRNPMELLLVGAAVETGLLEAWHDEKVHTPAELAETLCLDRRAVWTVAEALTALGYLDREGDGHRLAAAAKVFFHPEGLAFMHQYQQVKSGIELPAVLRNGKPAHRKRTPTTSGYFMQAMARSSQGKTERVAAHCLAGLKPDASVLDVGGGPLNFARAFTALGASVMVLDLPWIVELINPKLDPAEKIRFVVGDFTEGLPPGLFDLVFLSSVTHIYGEAENQRLFRQAAGILVPGGRIAISDFVRGEDPYAALFAVNMLVNTETGGTWTREEYTAWLGAAGFTQVQLANVASRQVITAVRPVK